MKETKTTDDGTGSTTSFLDEEIADTLVFLGKLLMHPDGTAGRSRTELLDNAARSFEEARLVFRRVYGTTNRKKEYSALSQMASAQAQIMSTEKQAEANYLDALEGLADTVGWEDGMTNHTAFQLAKLYKRQGNYEQAVSTLARMKGELTLVFGATDAKVLQLNGELAELWLLVGKGHSNVKANKTHNSKAQDMKKTTRTPDETAIALLEESLNSMPPNSPEYMRIFMQLEDLKEQIELAAESRGCAVISESLLPSNNTGAVT